MSKNYNEFLSDRDLKKKKIIFGKKHQISSLARFYGSEIKIGNNVRIDDDVVFKGKIELGSNVHIARGCTLSGGIHGIYVGELTALSNFVQVFSSTDDYFAPNIPAVTLNKNLRTKFSKIRDSKIIIGKGCIVGSMSVVLPEAEIEDFSTVGAFSIIHGKVVSGVYFSNYKKKKKFLKRRNLKEIKKKI